MTLSTFRLGQLNVLNSSIDLKDRYEQLARAIVRERIDVINLEEVIDKELLMQALEPTGLVHFTWGEGRPTGSGKGIDYIGTASRYPLAVKTNIYVENAERPVLCSGFKVEERTFYSIAAHLSWGSKSEGKRLSEAMAINNAAEKLTDEDPDCAVLLAGDLNADDQARTVRYLQGLDLSLSGDSTYWTDAFLAHGKPEIWATTDQGKGTFGPATARQFGISLPECLPARRIDYLMAYGWRHGKFGYPLSYGRFGGIDANEAREISDHYGIWSDIII